MQPNHARPCNPITRGPTQPPTRHVGPRVNVLATGRPCTGTGPPVGIGNGTCSQMGPATLHKLRINRHNKAVQEIHKFLISNTESHCYILMNAGKIDDQPQENTMPQWLLPCACNNQTQRCQCNAKLRPYILYIRNHPYNAEPPNQPNPTLTVQFIEFTYCNDRYSPDKIDEKIVKYEGLIEDIKTREWKVDPLLVLIARARGSTYKLQYPH
jgi:hypothetical protein